MRRSPDAGVIAVVPAFRTAGTIADVLRRMPPEISQVVVVDDASPDGLSAVVEGLADARVVLVRHPVNRGVGGAMKSGFARALELGASVVVKVDSDGQMDPLTIPRLVAPILGGEADLAKGNRFTEIARTRRMPPLRRIGNLALSFAAKLASGYWSVFDPCNGFVAIRADLLRNIEAARLSERYFFEISLLCEAYLARAVVQDVAMPTVYEGEPSSLSPLASFFDFLPRLAGRVARRVGVAYFLRDFNIVSVFLVSGIPLGTFGMAWSLFHWLRSWKTGVIATTGTVMIGVLAIILSFQLLLEALVLDVQAEPGRRRP